MSGEDDDAIEQDKRTPKEKAEDDARALRAELAREKAQPWPARAASAWFDIIERHHLQAAIVRTLAISVAIAAALLGIAKACTP